MAQINLEKVRKQYGNITALDGISCSINHGEIFGVVGASGCGKSTLLRLICGLDSPTSGEIYLGTECITDVLPKDRGMSILFQHHTLFPHMKAITNIAFACTLRHMSRRESVREARLVAEQLHVSGLLNRYPHELSGGEKQRVALARAFIARPEVILLDEPLSSLDAPLRQKLQIEIRNILKEAEITAIYVTHDQHEANMVSDRIAVMSPGTIEQIGRPQELYDTPATEFVASFIGSPAMNILWRGQSEQEQGRYGFWIGELFVPFPSTMQRRLPPYSVGIRPEHIRLSLDEKEDDSLEENDIPSVPGRILDIRAMGIDTLIDVCVNENVLVVRTTETAHLKSDLDVNVEIDLNHLHFFDRSGKRIN